MADFIRVENLAKIYRESGFLSQTPAVKVLSDINLKIQEGESVALVGASGSGKSTLCRLLLGIEPPSSGEIFWKEQAFTDFSQEQWRAFHQEVQMVFQDAISAVNPRRFIHQIVSEPLLYLRRMDKKMLVSECEALINQVGLLPEVLYRKAGQLSGGQLQRVGIARALAAKPKLIALDESLSSLDLVLQQQMIELLKSVQRQSGTSFLLVTHDLRLVDLLCQRTVVLDGGEIVENRAPGDSGSWSSAMGKTLASAILPAMPA